MKYRLCSFLFFILLLQNTLYAQAYSYQHFDTKNGLADNYVYHAVQDHDGFLWFATANGVSRFDGTKFQNFTTDDGLPHNEILKLFVDSKNRVWMLPFKNSLCYYYQNKIYNANNDSLLSKIKLKGNPIAMQEDKKENLVIIDIQTIIRVNIFGEVSTFLNSKDNWGNNTGISIDNNNNIFVAKVSHPTRNLEYCTVGLNGELIKNEKLKYIKNSKIDFSKFHLYNDNQVVQYGYTKNAKSVFSITNIQSTFTFDTVFTNPINSFSNISSNTVHINTKRGCIEWHFTDNKKTINYLPSENIAYSFEDNEHNKWFTTLGSGIFRLVSSDVKNINFSEKEAVKNQIHSIFADNDLVVAGSGEKKIYTVKNEKINTATDINKAETGRILKIFKFDNRYFLLCESELFSTTNFITFANESTFGYSSFKDIDFTNNGDFYFATHACLLKKAVNKTHEVIFGGRCFNVCVADNFLYFSNLNGLNRINLKNNKHQYLGEIDSLLQRRTTKLLWHNNLLWIGTSETGLLSFDGNKIIHKISIQSGLTSNIISALYADKNCIYVGTDKGFNKIEISNNTVVKIAAISIQNGLISNKITGICKQKGIMYAATPYGISFFKDTVMQNASNCDVKITDLIVDGKLKQDALPIVLTAGSKNSLQIKFVGISYKAAEGTAYFYRLKGIGNNEWKPTVSNSLEFVSLPSGTYLLEIKAVNGFGKESPRVELRFKVAKMLIEHWWFRLSVLACLIGLIWWLFSLQTANIKKKEKQKLETNLKMAGLEQMALKAQMNPHFIFNCLNSIQQYVIEKDVQGANKFISKFSKLIRQTLDNSGKEKISLEEEINFLSTYLALEKMRFEDKFDYTIDVENTINIAESFIPPMLLQPFIENSIRHGIRLKKDNEGLIEVKIEDKAAFILCRIKDNGIGREAAAQFKTQQHIQYQSKGLLLTRQRIDVLNSNNTDLIKVDIYDKHLPESGTEVVIQFPKSFTENRPLKAW